MLMPIFCLLPLLLLLSPVILALEPNFFLSPVNRVSDARSQGPDTIYMKNPLIQPVFCTTPWYIAPYQDILGLGFGIQRLGGFRCTSPDQHVKCRPVSNGYVARVFLCGRADVCVDSARLGAAVVQVAAHCRDKDGKASGKVILKDWIAPWRPVYVTVVVTTESNISEF